MTDLLMKREALFQDDCRWILRRIWGEGPRICWGACNPSLADDRKEDPTLRRMIRFSQRWGFGRMSLWNFWPWITPDQSLCRQWALSAFGEGSQVFDPYRRDALQCNLDWIAKECEDADAVVVAVGNAYSWDIHWCDHVIERIREIYEGPIHCIGKTRHGYPTHPLARGKHRVPDDAPLLTYLAAA